MVLIDIQLSEELAEKARNAGLLTSEKIAELLEAELLRQRQEAAERMFKIMDELQAATREEFGHMTEDEFMEMVNEIVHEVRAEQQAKRDT